MWGWDRVFAVLFWCTPDQPSDRFLNGKLPPSSWHNISPEELNSRWLLIHADLRRISDWITRHLIDERKYFALSIVEFASLVTGKLSTWFMFISKFSIVHSISASPTKQFPTTNWHCFMQYGNKYFEVRQIVVRVYACTSRELSGIKLF